MAKKIIAIISVLIVGFLSWYLCIKPQDYIVTFKAKTTVGTINQSLKKWTYSLKNSSNLQQENSGNLLQQLKFKDSVHSYKWEIFALNDSMSKVKVSITDKKNSFQNKVTIPFFITDFEKRTKRTVTGFAEILKDHLKKIKVTIVADSDTRASYCAYVSLRGIQLEKAQGMIKNYAYLNAVLTNHNIKLNGTPFLEVTKWNLEKDSIAYNFCFPIIKSDSLPQYKDINYKQYHSIPALKAVYNGNYMTSDRAWYALLAYAKQNNIAVHETPLEVFYNNPNYGGDALRWKAEIYMPIKNK
jgi:effector-binding domain-containing protein